MRKPVASVMQPQRLWGKKKPKQAGGERGWRSRGARGGTGQVGRKGKKVAGWTVLGTNPKGDFRVDLRFTNGPSGAVPYEFDGGIGVGAQRADLGKMWGRFRGLVGK